MKNLFLITSALLLSCAAIPAHADTVTYAVSVDTASQVGQGGYIDFELNAGSFPSQDIAATVTGFSGATLIPGDPNNDAIGTTGSLPGDVIFDNQTSNDYFEALTFGNNISFFVTLSGPGLSATGSSTGDSGTIFQLSFLDPTISSFLFTDDPNGTAALIDVAADGTSDIATQPGTTVAATPEPTTFSLVCLGGVLTGMARKWRSRAA
jgi:hypothetical protein